MELLRYVYVLAVSELPSYVYSLAVSELPRYDYFWRKLSGVSEEPSDERIPIKRMIAFILIIITT